MAEKLTREMLCRQCDSSELGFETTTDVTPVPGTIGQERAMSAIDFGLSLESKGFNIYILGESGTGKMTSIMQQVQALADKREVPDDWCYVYNLRNPDEPKALSLLPGEGIKFHKDMEELINFLRQEIPKIFESKEYEKQRIDIIDEFQKK